MCCRCFKTFIWKRPLNKIYREQHWFRLWVQESYSIRQLVRLSGYSASKLKRIKNYWLEKSPSETIDYGTCKHLIYDGTYFHKDGCFIILMNAQTQKTISKIYAKKEGYKIARAWFLALKNKKLDPRYITMDGERGVMRAAQEVWPKAKIQRCLYHIQSQGMSWLRTHPKTQAGQDLRCLLSTLCSIKSVKERDIFIERFYQWLEHYHSFVESLPKGQVAYKDLRRAVSLIDNAIPDMFHYLDEPDVHKTSNALESYFSRLKADYRRHRGLTQENKIQYLKWYTHYKNGPN